MAGRSAKPVKRAVIFGLDGADLRYIMPLVEAGELPTVARLLRRGIAGPCRSGAIPVTGVCWPMIYTGKNPAKTGIVVPSFPVGDAPARCISDHAQGIRTEAFWNMLNRQGLSVGLLNLPVTHRLAPWNEGPVEGFWIPGFDTPGSVPPCHPAGLIQDSFGGDGYPLLAMQHAISAGEHSGAGYCRRLLDAHQEALRRVLEKHPCEVLMTNVQVLDFVGHQSADRTKIEAVYRAVDRWMARVLGYVADDAVVVAISDHGFAPARYRLGMNLILERLGLARFGPVRLGPVLFGKAARTFSGPMGRVAGTTERLWAGLPAALRSAAGAVCSCALPQLRTATGGYVWEDTRVFTTGLGTLFVHSRPRYRGGTVPAHRVDATLREAENKLGRIIAHDGQSLFRFVRTAQVWDGPFLRFAPEAVATTRCTGYAYSGSTRSGRTFEPWDRPGGFHAPCGILLMSGPGLRRDRWVEGLELRDMVPNLLAALGLCVPEGVDRAPRAELFVDPLPGEDDLRMEDWKGGGELSYVESLDAGVEERLRGLGYL